jgi:hypothetical protein
MDYESNFSNIKKILRLPNLMGASEVLPAYIVSKKWQNIPCSSRSGISTAAILCRGMLGAPPSLSVQVRCRRRLRRLPHP